MLLATLSSDVDVLLSWLVSTFVDLFVFDCFEFVSWLDCGCKFSSSFCFKTKIFFYSCWTFVSFIFLELSILFEDVNVIAKIEKNNKQIHIKKTTNNLLLNIVTP